MLTKKEHELLQDIAESGYNKERLCTKFCVTQSTIKAHLNSAYSKLGVSNLTDAVVKALKQGFINLN